VNECKQAVAKILFQDKRKEIDDISLSHRTVSRRIEELADNVELNLTQIASSFEYYLLAIDESNDVSDAAQFLIFLKGSGFFGELQGRGCEGTSLAFPRPVGKNPRVSLEPFNLTRLKGS